jgi:phthalate 4,5-dioxygenase oxygenase subunit
MLSAEENELIARVEGDAPAGALLRRYWLPAALADELAESDGTPVRIRLVGQELVAFRDTAGRLGALDAACPHRLASLALGRNEEHGIRCIYHGWKFDVGGRCVEMPTEPEGYGFSSRTSVRSYPVREAGGLVWTYLGPPECEPPFPAFDWTALPRSQVAPIKFVERANYVQATEGAVDTAHTMSLHRGVSRDWKTRTSISTDLSPRLETEDTNYGFRYAAIRTPNENPDTTKYVRVTNYIFPTTVLVPRPMDRRINPIVQLFIPMDDERTMHYSVFFSADGQPVDEPFLRANVNWHPGRNLDGGYNLAINEDNCWLQDRVAMKDGSQYTGITGFPLQDVACQESMGAIVDRTREHLGTSDIAIIRMRRRLIENIRRVMDGGDPIGVDGSVDFPHLRSEQRIIGIDEPWQQVGAFAGEYAGTP